VCLGRLLYCFVRVYEWLGGVRRGFVVGLSGLGGWFLGFYVLVSWLSVVMVELCVTCFCRPVDVSVTLLCFHRRLRRVYLLGFLVCLGLLFYAGVVFGVVRIEVRSTSWWVSCAGVFGGVVGGCVGWVVCWFVEGLWVGSACYGWGWGMVIFGVADFWCWGHLFVCA